MRPSKKTAQPFDAAIYIKNPGAVDAFMPDAPASKDAGFIAHCLSVITRSESTARVSIDTGLNDKQRYKILSEQG